jgi:hypothetical protein
MEKSKPWNFIFGATVKTPRNVTTINYSTLGTFPNFKMEWKLSLVSYVLPVKLKDKQYHLCSQNCIQLESFNP